MKYSKIALAIPPMSSPQASLAPSVPPRSPQFATTYENLFADFGHCALDPVQREQVANAVRTKVLLFDESLFDGSRATETRLDPVHLDARFNHLPDGLHGLWKKWSMEVLDRASHIYTKLGDGQAVFMTVWHPKTYGDITHTSVVLLCKTAGGPVVRMMHHESMPVPSQANALPQGSQKPDFVALILDSYDSRPEFAVLSRQSAPPISELPIFRSLRRGGFPGIAYTVIPDFQAACAYLDEAKRITSQAVQAAQAGQDLSAFRYTAHELSSVDQSQVGSSTYRNVINRDGDSRFLRLNHCLLAIANLYAAGRGPNHELLFGKTHVEDFGEPFKKLGLLGNSKYIGNAARGASTFQTFGRNLAIDPSEKPDLPTPGYLLELLRTRKITDEQYRQAIAFLRILPGWGASIRSKL